MLETANNTKLGLISEEVKAEPEGFVGFVCTPQATVDSVVICLDFPVHASRCDYQLF